LRKELHSNICLGFCTYLDLYIKEIKLISKYCRMTNAHGNITYSILTMYTYYAQLNKLQTVNSRLNIAYTGSSQL